MSDEVDKPWTMAAWMEPFRPLIGNTGGSSVEELMNDDDYGTNIVRGALVLAVSSQVDLLCRAHAAGLLAVGGASDV